MAVDRDQQPAAGARARWRTGLRAGWGSGGLAHVVATPTAMAVATGVFFGIGAIATVVLTFVASEPGANLTGIRVIAAAAGVIVAVLLLVREQVPVWTYPTLNFVGSNLVFLDVCFSRGGMLAVGLATVFAMVPLHSFTFFRRLPAAMLTGYSALLAGVLVWPVGLLPGAVVVAALMINVVAAGAVAGLVRSAERAERDGVTGLPNRRGFDRALERALLDGRHDGIGFTVGHLDLDHFRRTNETVGRAGGDERLLAAGRRWRGMLPAEACLAHCGGGEFVLLLPGMDAETAGELVEALRSTLPYEGTASAGLAEWRPDDTASLLLSRADASLYRAKQFGRDRIDPQVGLSGSVRELRAALDSGAFVVDFQPIVDLATDMTLAAEALVRWNHPVRGRIPPIEFIPLAEESGVIVELGRMVLEQACISVLDAERAGRYLRSVTVNVAGRQLQVPGYADDVLAVLCRTGLDPARLVLEVTESSLAAEEEAAVRALEGLRRHGIRIAIDDFGTGYSSLSRLAALPVDILKIDKAFVQSIRPGRPAPIIASITALADALGLSTVAEGIEQIEQAHLLAAHGCEKGQGWLYGRPGTMDQLVLPPVEAASPREVLSPQSLRP